MDHRSISLKALGCSPLAPPSAKWGWQWVLTGPTRQVQRLQNQAARSCDFHLSSILDSAPCGNGDPERSTDSLKITQQERKRDRSMLSVARKSLAGREMSVGRAAATLLHGDDEVVERLLSRVSANPRSRGPRGWEEEAAVTVLEAWVTPRHSCAWSGGVSLPCASRQAGYF